MTRKSWLIICIAFLSCQTLIGQAGESLRFTFKNFNTTNGLVSNQVFSILQDSLGYIWAGSTDGLQRFDGFRFRTFRHKTGDSSSIPSNSVLQLLLDKKNRFWVLLSDGTVGTFDTKRFTFSEVKTRSEDPNDLKYASKKLVSDEKGNIFLILWPSKILLLDETKKEFSADHFLFELRAGWQPLDFVQQPGTQKYWTGLNNGGFVIYDNQKGTLSYAGHNTGGEKIIDYYGTSVKPYNLFFDKKGRLWFQYWETYMPLVYCYDLPSGKPVIERFEFISALRTYHETAPFFEQQNGDIWIRGIKILARFNEQSKKFELVQNGFTDNQSIDYDHINSLIEDNEHNIWAASSNNGIYIFNPATEYFTSVLHYIKGAGTDIRIGNGSPNSFVQLKDNTILSGTWGDGLYRYDNRFHPLPLHIKGISDQNFISAWSMCASRDSNTIWIGAQPGLWKYDQQKNFISFINPSLLNNKTVRQLAEDRYGNLWLGIQNAGLRKWIRSKGQENFNAGIRDIQGVSPDQNIHKIIIDSKGYVWVATARQGVLMIDPATDRVVLNFCRSAKGAFHLTEDAVSSLLELNDSTMVFATSNRIITYNRNEGTASVLGSDDSLSGYIAAMEKDRQGNIWVSTTTGLYQLLLRSRIFIRFDRRDGIINDEFSLAASYKLPDGRLIFGGTSRFIAFNPASIKITNPHPPRVYITDFKVKNRYLLVDSLLQLETVALKNEQNALAIDFSTLHFISPYIIRYKMEGLDKDWKISDQNFSAVYNYLPPGTYTFRVRAEDTDGNKGPVTSVQIVIAPPFWKTWWFYSLLVLAAGVLLFWLDRERMQKKETIQKMRSDIASNLHEEVNIALNNINILSEMARLKAEKDTAKAIEYIEQIHTKSHNMIIAMDDMLWSIDPANDSMAKATERLREYIEALKNRHDVQIDLLVDKKVDALKLNMKLRQSIFRLFKGGIANFIKTGADHCRIHIGIEKGTIVYTVEFDNSKTDFQQLNNLIRRQELENWLGEINARLIFETHKTNSTAKLVIPLR